MENKGIKRSVKAGIAAAVAIVVAGVSVFAINVSAGENITESEAKQIALAEVKGADVSNITKFKKDKDDGRTEYDVEIIYDGFEYDFEISAKDGTIFDQSKEKADAGDLAKLKAKEDAKKEAKDEENKTVVVDQSGSSSNSSSSEISLERAKSIALGQVPGASSGNITKAYKDYDDGRAEYDIEIRYNGYEYDFEISAASGKILSKDVDRYAVSNSGGSSGGNNYDDRDDDWDDRYDDDRDDRDDDRYDD